MSKFLRRSLMIFIIKGFRTIVFIFIVISIPCSSGKIYKGETGRSLKVRLEKHRKAVVRGEIEKLGMADHIWREKGNHLPLWDKVEIIDRAEHWRIRRLKESAHMLGNNDLLSRPSIELNTIWEPIIKKAWWKKKVEITTKMKTIVQKPLMIKTREDFDYKRDKQKEIIHWRFVSQPSLTLSLTTI